MVGALYTARDSAQGFMTSRMRMILARRQKRRKRSEEMKLIFSLIFMAAGVFVIYLGYYKGWWN